MAENPLGIHPVEFKVLVRVDEKDETERRTASGRLIIPDTAKLIQQEEGVLIEIGGRAFEDFGDPKPQTGDRVMFNRYAGCAVHDSVERTVQYRLLNDKDINAILKN